MTLLEGVVVPGIGNFSYRMEKLSDHYARKTGMSLFPGTLNVRLQQPCSLPAASLRLEAGEYGGAVSVNLVPCSIQGRRAFMRVPTLTNASRAITPKTIVEIACDIKPRDHFHFRDGYRVSIEVLDSEWFPPST